MKLALKTLLSINSRRSFNTCLYNSINLLKDISKQGLITEGAVVHGSLIKMGMSSEKYISVKLLIMYLNCRKSLEINQMLREFNGFDLVVHNCLINANVEWGELDEAQRLFDEMPERNEVSWTALVSGLLKYGRIKEAMWNFGRNPFHDVFSWTATISGLVQNGLAFEGMKLFLKMIQSGFVPNDVTFTTVMRACGDLGDLKLGMIILNLIVKLGFEGNVSVSNSLISFSLRLGELDLAQKIFDRMKERDVVSWTAILDMHFQMDNLEEARRIFDDMPEKNEVSWSAMIARYSQSGYAEEAVLLFLQMVQNGVKPSTSCFSSAISACASLMYLQAGRTIHGHVIKSGIQKDVYISSSLVDLYCKCGDTEAGRRVFDSTIEKNVVFWNSMISGYGLNGQLEKAQELFDKMPNKNCVSWNSLIASYLTIEQFESALEVFNDMLLSGELPNESTFSTVLCACASLSSLEKGNNLHGKIIKLGLHYNIYVVTALIDMYSKSGNIENSWKLFNRMARKNEICWTVMIQGLAENGFAEESLALFEEMVQSSVAPNDLILLAVLFACSHRGLVDKGLHYFNTMQKLYGIKPIDKHYTCVVDMLSRSGHLSEADKFISNMPCEPEANTWAALLSGCQAYKDEKLAQKAARKLLELEEKKPGSFVLLSNVYASAGRWLEVLNMRKLMEEKGVRKTGGCSWIEIQNQVHVFYSQDGSHTNSVEIFGVLELLKYEMVIL